MSRPVKSGPKIGKKREKTEKNELENELEKLLKNELENKSKKLSDLKFNQIEEFSKFIHEGWVENYIYWRDHKPWTTDKNYTKPSQCLGDKRRNDCAKTKYLNLPEDEKLKDRIIAKFIYEQLTHN